MITTRAEAKIQGSKTYFTNKPCLNKHIALRQTSNGNCIECDKTRESLKIAKKKYAKANPEVCRRNIENVRRIAREWSKRNRSSCKANLARYRALKLKAQPKWLTIKHLAELVTIYNNCPKGCQVDHILPLRGKTVCGLHVPWNLQYLKSEVNQSKGNKIIASYGFVADNNYLFKVLANLP